MRYFMRLAYNGANFHGWQIQPHDTSVQETLEHAMSMVLRTPIAITGAGRTDTGVNASMMIAHFDVEQPLEDSQKLVHKLNGIIGRDISIYTIFPVADDAHARFDATSRTYKYYLHTRKNPFLEKFSWDCHQNLDFDLMNEAAAKLPEFTDFTSFSKLHTDVKTNNCDVTYAHWNRITNNENGLDTGEQWVFTVTADRFLRNMVRAIVGTLVDVGTHKITVEQFCDIIRRKDRCSAGQSMPGHALFLHNITYPYEIK